MTSKIIGKKIIHHREIDSTSDEAKRLLHQDGSEGTVVVADSQTQGRGKPGNRWYSPRGGIYLSTMVKPFKNPKELSTITILGAQAAISAIKKISGLQGKIKFPNDILINNKKVGGVLVERLTSGHLIIGIGINLNLNKDSFPEEIKNQATSLKIESKKEFPLEHFIQILISELDREYLRYLEHSVRV